jgi:hypothetical protein
MATPGRRRTNRPMPQGRYNLLWTALGVPADYNVPILKFMYITSKRTLLNAARLRKIPRQELKTKAGSIIHILAGTALGNKVIIDGSITHQQLYNSWHRSQHNSYLVESGLLDQATEYNAMFHPFPEGVDDGNPDSCKTFWITIPNVNTIVHQIHIVSFLFACKHVSLQGFGGRVVRESLLTSQDLLSKLCIFVQNNAGQTYSLSEFLDLFHNEYLVSADSTYHELRIPRDINMDQRKEMLKTKVRLFLSLLEIPDVQEDLMFPMRRSAVVIVGTFSLVIMQVSQLHPDDHFVYHVIIPKQRTYFIGLMKHEASTHTILKGMESLSNFLERILNLYSMTNELRHANLFQGWIYIQNYLEQHIQLEEEIESEEGGGDGEYSLQIQDIANDNLYLFMEEEDQEDEDGESQENEEGRSHQANMMMSHENELTHRNHENGSLITDVLAAHRTTITNQENQIGPHMLEQFRNIQRRGITVAEDNIENNSIDGSNDSTLPSSQLGQIAGRGQGQRQGTGQGSERERVQGTTGTRYSSNMTHDSESDDTLPSSSLGLAGGRGRGIENALQGEDEDEKLLKEDEDEKLLQEDKDEKLLQEDEDGEMGEGEQDA